MSKIIEAWEEVLREAISKDFDDQQFALFQIGLVLRRHNPFMTPDTDMIEESLPRELLRLALNYDRQRDVVIYLAALVKNHPRQADLFLFALSNAHPDVLVDPLLTLLQELGEKLKPDAAYQAILAIESMLRANTETVKAGFKKHDILSILDTWINSHDELVGDRSASLASRIEAFIAEA